jgi:hypothetical protein
VSTPIPRKSPAPGLEVTTLTITVIHRAGEAPSTVEQAQAMIDGNRALPGALNLHTQPIKAADAHVIALEALACGAHTA